jgi:putative inorganic carbon (HCO3(-)) transporter
VDDVGHAHNIALQVALDLGLPGLISYLALLGGALASAWRAYRAAQDRVTRAVALGSGTGLIAHLIWCMADALPLGTRSGFLWWIMLGLALSGTPRAAQDTPS